MLSILLKRFAHISLHKNGQAYSFGITDRYLTMKKERKKERKEARLPLTEFAINGSHFVARCWHSWRGLFESRIASHFASSVGCMSSCMACVSVVWAYRLSICAQAIWVFGVI
jgi:hypothetical protein